MFTENKITEFKNKISALADRPQMSAKALKEYFDSSAEELRVRFNALIDALDSFSNASFDAVDYNAADGKLTFTFGDGSTQEIDLPLELLVERGHYDADKQSIILTLANSDVLTIPVSDLIDEYEADEKTLHMTASETGRVFSVKDGVFAPEAPADGKSYVRSNKSWQEAEKELEEITLADADNILKGVYKVVEHDRVGLLCACLDLYVYDGNASGKLDTFDVENFQTILWSDGRIEHRSRAEYIIGLEYGVVQNEDGTYRLKDGYVFDCEWSRWESVFPSLKDYATKTYVDYGIRTATEEKWDLLVDETLTENLATEFRYVFAKSYKCLRFKIAFKGSANTTLTNVRFKRAKEDGGGQPGGWNYLKYSSNGNIGTTRLLSGTACFDLDNKIIIKDAAIVNAHGMIDGGATYGGDTLGIYPTEQQIFPEFYMYLGGSIADDGTLSGNVLGAGTTIQVWGCEK